MPDQLLQLDRHLFYFINHDLANPLFDWLMPYLRNPKLWIPLYVFIAGFCIWKFKKMGVIMILAIGLSAGFADFTANHFIKLVVKRDRPCRDAVVSKTDIARVPCGTGYSFPSIHAADHFAVAFCIIMVFYKRWRWIWLWGFLWAGLICFAQVYVGVHFPIDVFCGALYGIFVGWLFAVLYRYLISRMALKSQW